MDALKIVIVLHIFTFGFVWCKGKGIANSDCMDYMPGEYIVTLKSPNNENIQDFVKESLAKFKSPSKHIDVLKVYKFLNTAFLIIKGDNDTSILTVAKTVPGVKGIEANVLLKLSQDDGCVTQHGQNTPWGLSRIANRSLHNFSEAQYSYMTNDGEDTYAYVFDSGIYLDHEEFEGRAEHGYTAEYIQPEGDNDLVGHGTHVAGIIAGRTYGVAKKSRVISVKVFNESGCGSMSGIIEGMHWVYNNFTNDTDARAVASLSLSNPGSTAVDEATIELIDAGLTVVAAAGNEYGCNACCFSPARATGVITVGASDKQDDMSFFSNVGDCIDILAPGEDIISCGISSPNAVRHSTGTSMSTPHVSGAILRYLSQKGQPETPSDIRRWLISTATSGVVKVYGPTPSRLLYAPCNLNVTIDAFTTDSVEVTTESCGNSNKSCDSIYVLTTDSVEGTTESGGTSTESYGNSTESCANSMTFQRKIVVVISSYILYQLFY